ncbi:hypothetical protein Sjap_010210 [Stephania japonica]|uniref:Uncharacterized protein n=1 Tax=Stephania japonica TaxID=461633 RepID=A0AAP0JB72_9MAGN
MRDFLLRSIKVTLISSVLDAIPVHFMSVYRLLAMVASKNEKLMRRFLWEKYDENTMAPLVDWKEVACPKTLGGLGIGKLQKRNEALASKWLWRFPREQDALWAKIIRSTYGIHTN